MSKTLADFRAILFDVDKTLLNTQKTISPRLAAALAEIQKQNIVVGICTGRALPTLRHYVLKLFAPNSTHVLAGGAQVVTSSEEVLWEQRIEGELVKQALASLEAEQPSYYVAQNDALYLTPGVRSRTDSYPWKADTKPIEELRSYDTPLFAVFDLTQEAIEIVNTWQDCTKKGMIDYGGKGYFDVTATGVTKWTGLQQWSTLTGIPVESIIGVGDSDNDEEFLTHVGWSVGMGNATPKIVEIADRIIGHTDEDGLAIYLESLLKGEPV